jgi:multisite-specific tRNA:(cytosine-C5)-methyltransferase
VPRIYIWNDGTSNLSYIVVYDIQHVCSWRIYPHLQNTGGFFVAVLERSPSFKPVPPKKKPGKRTVTEAEGTPEPSFREVDAERQVKRPRLDKDDHDLDVEMVDAENVEEKVAEEEKKQTGGRYKEDPYTYVDLEHPSVKQCL